MPRRSPRTRSGALVLAVALAAALAVGCGATGPGGTASSPGAGPSAAPSAAPGTFADYDAGFCGAFTSLIRAVGNPDAGTPSTLSKQLDDAVTAHDGPTADRAAAAMTAELETGRAHAASAARWQPAAATMAQMNRLLIAFQVSVAAKRAQAMRLPGAADPQAAFEQAGGVTAWSAVLRGAGSMPVPSGTVPAPCRAFSGQV